MKILVVYDTVSVKRNTEEVAKAVSEVLREKRFDVDCLFVKDVDPAGMKAYDCILAGSPTQTFRATAAIMKFLDGLVRDELSGKLGAGFDTQMRSRLSGNAAKGIEKKLEKLGVKIVLEPLVVHVEGKVNEMYLEEGASEKVKRWAENLVKVLPH